MKSRTIQRGLSVLVAIAPLVAGAAELRHPVSVTPGQQTRGARLGAPEVRLTLQDAIAMALEHNINLEVSRLALGSAEQGIFAGTGIFDPLFKADAGGSVANTPATTELAGASVTNQRQRTFDLSLGQLIPTGQFTASDLNTPPNQGPGASTYDAAGTPLGVLIVRRDVTPHVHGFTFNTGLQPQ